MIFISKCKERWERKSKMKNEKCKMEEGANRVQIFGKPWPVI